MSVFPIFNAFFAGLFIFGFFSWNVYILCLVSFFIFLSILLYLYESVSCGPHYVSSFWLFIFSEIAVFGSLLFCCLYFDYDYYNNLSSPLELPFLGCFLLLGSSLTITSYHHLTKWNYAWVPLLITISLGLGFVALQMVEMEEISVNLYDTTFHASCLCTVGLHFSHVVLGLVGLFTILINGLSVLGHYRCTIIVWYWHFVDYVWLFVYAFVYICFTDSL